MDNFDWKISLSLFLDYLTLERSMSPNSTQAYMRDLRKLSEFAVLRGIGPLELGAQDAAEFLAELVQRELSRSTIARTLSGCRTFYGFLLHSDRLAASPFELIDGPSTQRKLPVCLSVDDVLAMLDGVDLSNAVGYRNRAILECLYGCGLRVSELVGLRFGDIFEADGVVRVVGKGNKQRLVPMADVTMRFLRHHLEGRTAVEASDSKHSDVVFLNQRGGPLSRISVFKIVRDAAKSAGIQKEVYPHVLRHSFATHLVDAGADIRAVQGMLGHVNVSTTQVYTHVSTAGLRSAVERLRPAE